MAHMNGKGPESSGPGTGRGKRLKSGLDSIEKK